MYDYKRDFYGGQLRTNAFGRHIDSVTDFKFLPPAGLPPPQPTTVIVRSQPVVRVIDADNEGTMSFLGGFFGGLFGSLLGK